MFKQDRVLSNQSELNFQSKGQYWIKDQNISVRFYNDSMKITDLTNTYKRGKTCKQISIYSYNISNTDLYRILEDIIFDGFELKVVLDFFKDCDSSFYIEEFKQNVNVSVREVKGVYIFSPLEVHLKHFKPLKEEPKKWLKSHVVRLLVNKQFKNLKCDGKYSDDYAHDAETNCGKGSKDRLEMIEELITESAWSVYNIPNTKEISIDMYSFNTNSLEFVI